MENCTFNLQTTTMAKSKKSLAETHPELAKEWHPTKNASLTPNDVTPGSGKKVWWKCKLGEEHEWQAQVNNRTNGNGCPACSGRLVTSSTSLQTLMPELAEEWHSSKNGDLTPSHVTAGSGRKVWWKCPKGEDHVWYGIIAGRVNGNKCPICSGHKVSVSTSLQTLRPELALQWHHRDNKNLKPAEVSLHSNKKVWWKCDQGDDHVWLATISSRVNGNGCPICSNKIVVESNSLAQLYPNIASQWHPKLNEGISAKSVSYGSEKKVWWQCDKNEKHIWESSVNQRTSGRGCPYCRIKTVTSSTSLQALKPELAKEWHSTRNGDLSPSNVFPNSSKKVWWICSQGDDHIWQTSISNRNRGSGCPICANQKVVLSNSLLTTHPSLAMEWHNLRNGRLTASEISAGSNKKVWWKCKKGDDHEWQSSISSRKNGSGCPICAGKKTVYSNSLEAIHPNIAKEWHPTKNGKLKPSDVRPQKNLKVWWKCPEGDDHEWQSLIGHRASRGDGCTICSGHKAVLSNCLATLDPDKAKDWHPLKNGTLTPKDVLPYSGKKVWWKCDKGDDHEWYVSINSKQGCPVCSNQKVVLSNCLQTTHQKIANEWHPIKNGSLKPMSVVAGSAKKVWWQCDKNEDHEWKSQIQSRTNGTGCPYCTLTPQSKQELIITFELKSLFKRIDPKGFKVRLDGALRAIDIFIPKLNLCIEFDGSYWHKDKREIDKIKSNLLLKEGYSVIRVREEPLKKIHDTDVISKQPYNGKQVTNDILSMILSIYDLDSELVQRIKDYQSKDELQNERGLNRYIDKILKEKAEKK